MYRKKTWDWWKHLDFILLDMLCMHAAFTLSYMVRHGVGSPYGDSAYREAAAMLTVANFCVAILFSSYRNVVKRGMYAELTASIRHVCLVEAGMFAYFFATQTGAGFSRIVFYVFPFIYIVCTYTARTAWKGHLHRLMASSDRKSLVIVTTSGMLGTAVQNVKDNNYEMYRIAGIAVTDAHMTGSEAGGIPIVADMDTVTDYVCRNWVDEVLIIPSADGRYEGMADAFSEMGIAVHIAIMHDCVSGRKQQIERIGNFMVVTTGITFVSPLQLMAKRAIDIAGSLVGCVITLAVCLVFGPVIYMKSPGPILFTQTRVGRNGRKFRMYKLRTMYMDAEERKSELMKENRVKDGMMFKLDYDPRIIGNERMPDGSIKKGIGSFLRETSLDEFPQMINVLKGDMSLVGTRPPTVDEWERYAPRHRARLAVKPGITGLWQVSGRSNITDFEEVVKLDTRYINEWSLGLDMKIMVKTILVLLFRDGAL
jgi:exopolysaccharide biosynthesis polyprenyl glycosylphosphotransferase